AISPEDRYQTPQALMRTLLTFVKPESREHLVLGGEQAVFERKAVCAANGAADHLLHKVLIADDETSIRVFCRHILQAEGIQCDEAANGLAAFEAAQSNPYDLLLVDVDMPVISGLELLRRLRELPPRPHLKVIMISGHSTADEMARMLMAGADDYLTKPFSLIQLQGRVKAALRLKEAQDRSELLTRRLLAVNPGFEGNPPNPHGDPA